MKKLLTITICIIMCTVLLLTGCGTDHNTDAERVEPTDSGSQDNNDNQKGGSIVNAPGIFPFVKEKITIKAFAPKLSYISDISEGNDFTEWFENETNVHIDWELAPENALQEKKSLMLASGDYPDVIYGGLTKEEELMYGPQGVLIPLNKLIEENCIKFKVVMEDYPLLEESITTPDGNIYSMPTINECYHCMHAMRAWINQTWLDALELDMPTTTEEYYQVLKAFKEEDPNGNGKQDEIPLSGADGGWHLNVVNFFINSFIYNDGDTRFVFKNGELDINANKPEFKEALKYLHKLYDEGLMDQAALTQDRNQLVQLGTNADINILGSATAALWWDFSDSDTVENPRNREYVAMSPMKGPDGVQYAASFPFSTTTGAFAITSACEYPEVAIRLADFIYDYEGTLMSTCGMEDVSWRWAKDGENGLDGNQAIWVILNDITVTECNYYWGQMGPVFQPNDFRLGQAMEGVDQWNTEYRLFVESRDKYAAYVPPIEEVFPPVYIAAEDASEYTRLKTQLKDYIDESIARFISGDLDLEADWDAYVKDFDNLELNKYLEINMKAYNAQYN